ncbi:hypothetical protein E1258_25335 [Micromonospora sp. KC207]|nr:hypothetical protein E1258_25335 [Micromonospora sp. KC207]
MRAITCPPNALRAAAVGPRPVPGLIPVGDAACVTDPLYGRGMSLALTHAFAVADLVTRHCAPDPAQAHAARRLARELFLPWYRQAVVDGADRVAHWRAALHPGRPAPAERAGTLRAVGRAAAHDAVLWRGVMRVLMGLRELAEVCADDQFARRLAATAVPDRPAGGPTRADLLAAIGID